jgi:hypothetical protein
LGIKKHFFGKQQKIKKPFAQQGGHELIEHGQASPTPQT